jgi:hypothetical protein
MRSKLPITVTAFLCSLTTIAPVFAQSTGLEDMVGARAGQAENELQRRGYRNMRGEKGGDRSYTYWWNSDRRQCVSIATMNGRYDSITPTTSPDCRQSPLKDRERAPRYLPPARDNYRGRYGGGGDLSRNCKAEAAAAFDRRPSDITTNAPIRQRNGTIVQGWYDRNKDTRFFTCRFDEDSRFISVN